MLVYPLVSLGIMVLVTTVYAYGAVRFRTPLELALLIGAGVAVDAGWRRWRPGDPTGAPPPTDGRPPTDAGAPGRAHRAHDGPPHDAGPPTDAPPDAAGATS